jgi:glycosyltransferase involved in cell wall biosynthesis
MMGRPGGLAQLPLAAAPVGGAALFSAAYPAWPFSREAPQFNVAPKKGELLNSEGTVRVLLATSIKTWGGGEEWMLSAAAGLSRLGHDVTLAARKGSAILERAAEAKISRVEVSFRSDLDLESFLRIYRTCRTRKIEAACLNMDRVLRVAGTAARLAGTKAVLIRRGSEFPLKNGLLYRFTYRHVATGVIVNSRATERALCRNLSWKPAGGIHLLPNGIDVERFARASSRSDTRRSLGVAEDAPLLIIVGELTGRKNVAEVVALLPELTEQFPDLTLLLAGEGEERKPLEALARSLGVERHVRFLGFRRDVPDLLAASDLLVHPARVEGFGYAVGEAMASGLPVVATKASSLPEIVEDGETGSLFPAGDRQTLAKLVRAYLEDPSRRAREGAAGRARVRREFSWERRLVELEDLLRKEIERGASRSRKE